MNTTLRESAAPSDIKKREERKLLKELTSSQFRKFFDTRKVVRSKEYRDAAEMAAIHAEVHGDVNYVNIALELADDPNDKRALADWFCRRAGLIVEQTDGKFKVVKSKNPPDRTASLFDALTKTGTKTQLIGATSKVESGAGPKMPRDWRSRGMDMLDHPSRLPGSFGSGRKR